MLTVDSRSELPTCRSMKVDAAEVPIPFAVEGEVVTGAGGAQGPTLFPVPPPPPPPPPRRNEAVGPQATSPASASNRKIVIVKLEAWRGSRGFTAGEGLLDMF